ncbi:MAG: hypothetical protein ACFB50_17275 [Rubrobacteraceae bacterium]
MTNSRIEEDAMLLLGAFYDLSGGKPNEPVPVGGPESTEADAAAPRAGLDPQDPGCEVAVRYLVDRGYIKAVDEESTAYTLTVPGIERAKELRETG